MSQVIKIAHLKNSKIFDKIYIENKRSGCVKLFPKILSLILILAIAAGFIFIAFGLIKGGSYYIVVTIILIGHFYDFCISDDLLNKL